MTDRKTIQTLINDSYEARRVGDIDGVIEMFHPDAVFEIRGDKTTAAFVGGVKGHQDLRTVLGGLITSFEFLQRDTTSVIIDDDRAVVHSRVTIRFVPKNRQITTDIVDLWKFEHGKVVEFLEFVDTALINELIR